MDNELDDVILTEEELDAIGEIMNISMGSSATAVSAMLDRQVVITTPKLKQTVFKDVDASDLEPAIVVKISYIEGIQGSNIIMLRRHDMQLILDLLMGNEPVEDDEFEFDDMSMSAACEVMNQMMGASATALSEILNVTVNISTPTATLVEHGVELATLFDELSPEDQVVEVSFKMNIKGVMDSDFSCFLTTELTRKIVGYVRGDMDEAPPVASEPEPYIPPVVETPAYTPPQPVLEPQAVPVQPIPEQPAVSAQQMAAAPAAPMQQMPMAQTAVEPYGASVQPAVLAQQAPPQAAPAQPQAPPYGQPQGTQPPPYPPTYPQPGEQGQPVAPGQPPYYPPPGYFPPMPGSEGQQQGGYYPPGYPYPPQGYGYMQQYGGNPYGYGMGYPPQQQPPQQSESVVRPAPVNVKKAQFPTFADQNAAVQPMMTGNANLLMGVPLEVSIVIGKAKRKVKDILEFGQGTVMELDKQTGAPAEVIVNGQLLAYGDVIVIGDNFGVRITEIVGTKDLLDSLDSGG